ncbi:hypothetical protein SCWH03_28010 [Streptomyces pacificus]|uniref:DNA-binding protein n=1 Tax=Streptomyces pacificus TaxID=2705029 RepID=A0A6A0AW51_9ACTN|nr:hypothetical protein SCWH03_28010 [Streptomyces pacificus]
MPAACTGWSSHIGLIVCPPCGSAGRVDGHVATGTWTEQTATDGYYRGARYHGAIQLLVEPTGRRMTGKWVGFGKEFDVNSGPWELVFQDASTTKATLEAYNRRPDA